MSEPDQQREIYDVARFWGNKRLGDIVCVTFIRGVDEAEALRRFGGYPDTIRRFQPDELGDLMSTPTAACVP